MKKKEKIETVTSPTPPTIPASTAPAVVERYETFEVKLSEIFKSYITTLPNSAEWQILAVDDKRDVLLLKRKVKE